MPSTLKVVKASEFDLLSMVVFLLAIVDTIFYVWILSSINNLLSSLASRRQATKYLLYRNFRAVLFVSLFFALVWAVYGSIIALDDGHGVDNNWADRWTVDALYELTYFAVFVAVAYMWAPSKNSQRYAYSVELSQLEDDAEYQEAGGLELAVAQGGDGSSGSFRFAFLSPSPLVKIPSPHFSPFLSNLPTTTTTTTTTHTSKHQNTQTEADLDDEYGGKLSDESDPFKGKGALDLHSAVSKKQ
jgi:hypothetical protein